MSPVLAALGKHLPPKLAAALELPDVWSEAIRDTWTHTRTGWSSNCRAWNFRRMPWC